MKLKDEIKLATVKKCSWCEGKGYYGQQGWDTCTHCGGTGKLIGVSITIEELKKLLSED